MLEGGNLNPTPPSLIPSITRVGEGGWEGMLEEGGRTPVLLKTIVSSGVRLGSVLTLPPLSITVDSAGVQSNPVQVSVVRGDVVCEKKNRGFI